MKSEKRNMKFNATVSSRSSSKTSGPPGEAEVLTLNPQRHDLILKVTGWDKLVNGTLNLEVQEDVVHRLLLYVPAIREPGIDVKYPEQYQHIPRKRVGYLYFKGTIQFGNKQEPVLIRRACNPLRNRLEAFAPVVLRTNLDLSDCSNVICRINE